MDEININIKDFSRGYSLDEVTCYEKPPVIVLEHFNNEFGSLFLILCKMARLYKFNDCVSVKKYLIEFMEDKMGISVDESEKEINIIDETIAGLKNGKLILFSGNLNQLFYSEHYNVSNWKHFFIVKGYSESRNVFVLLDNTQMTGLHIPDREKKYYDFNMVGEWISRMYESHNKHYGLDYSFILVDKNDNFGKLTAKEILIYILDSFCNLRKRNAYKQIDKLNEIIEVNFVEQDFKKVKFLSGKLLNMNKYKNVLFDEMIYQMMKYHYDMDLTDRLKTLKDKIYNEWSNYISLALINIKRSKNKEQCLAELPDTIHNLENEFDLCLAEFRKFLWEQNPSDSSNLMENYIDERNVDNIITCTDHTCVFTFKTGKIYNYWIQDEAPKYKIFAGNITGDIHVCAKIEIEKGFQEDHFQAGIYIKNSDGRACFAAIDNENKFVLDILGENNNSISMQFSYIADIKVDIENDNIRAILQDENGKIYSMDGIFDRTNYMEIGILCKTWGNGGRLGIRFTNIGFNQEC